MITVIADDITGAAEIAGAAWRHGLNVELSTDFVQPQSGTDVFVIATNTRSNSEPDAIKETQRIAELLKNNHCTVFKKTDSVLRGHVVTELNALIETLGFTRALLLPQNPSKNRTIANGTYYVDGKPLAETAFKDDPEYPATSSYVTDILGSEIALLPLDENLTRNTKRINIAEASNLDHVKTQVNKISTNILPAGGADMFKALLQKMFPNSNIRHENIKITPCEYSIIACGSTQSEDITNRSFAKASKTYTATIPDDVFNGEPADTWLLSLPNLYLHCKSLAISVGHRENGGLQCALRLKKIMAEAVGQLVKTHKPELIIIEGGATAYSIIKRLNWNKFSLKAEYRPGIVGMTYGNTEIVLKPGSYPWGDIL